MSEWQTVDNQAEWDEALMQFADVSLQQSWQWGEVNQTLGHHVERHLLTAEQGPHAAMQIIIKSAKRGKYLEVPGGPLLDWSDSTLAQEVVRQMVSLARANSCVFARFRPQLPDTPDYRAFMKQVGAKRSLMHISADHTSIVDLEPSEDDLLTAMRQQTRYEVRRSTRRGITVEQTSSADVLDTFHALQAETAKRQGFIPPSRAYLQACVDQFGADAHIYTATNNTQLLNVALVLWFGHEAAYFEAASTPEARREPGAYAIVWRAMQDAKSAGLSRFNLWGTAPPDAHEHRYAGVTTFKRGFGGDDVAYLPAHDLVIKQFPYLLTRSIEYVRKKRRKL